MKLNYYIVILIFVVAGCNSGGLKSTNLSNNFTADAVFCAEHELPLTSFQIGYPDDVLVFYPEKGQPNSKYIEFADRDGDKFVEGLVISYFPSDNKIDDVGTEKFLATMIQSFQSQIAGLEVVFNGKAAFAGKQLYQAHFKYQITDASAGDKGTYLACIVLVPPVNENTNGVMFLFQGTANSDIKNFPDFYTKGKMAAVYNSFQFTKDQ